MWRWRSGSASPSSEAFEPRPQPHVGRERRLRLQADEVLHGRDGIHAAPPQQRCRSSSARLSARAPSTSP